MNDRWTRKRWKRTTATVLAALMVFFSLNVAFPTAAHAAIAPTIISGANDPMRYDINAGIAQLSNGGKAVLYIDQHGGDPINWEPPPVYTGKVLVYDAAKHLVATVDATELGSGDYSVYDAHIAPLSNGGFVVAWSVTDEAGDYLGAYYETFDNNGAPSGSPGNRHKPISNAGASEIRVTGLSSGGFAVVLSDQTTVSNNWLFIFSESGGTYTKTAETSFGNNSQFISTALEPSAKLWFHDPRARIIELSDGSIVVEDFTYVYVGSSYTPLGDMLYKFDSAGNPSTFANGYPHLRVNWTPATSRFELIALDGDRFATINYVYANGWEYTILNNDGTPVTGATRSVNVTGTGGGTKTYHAETVKTGAVNQSNGYNSVSWAKIGDNIAIVMLNASGGFDIAEISATTGEVLIAPTDSGIAPSTPGWLLANPEITSNVDGGWALTYDEYYDMTSNTFEYGIAAPANMTYSVTYDANHATSGSIPADGNAYESGDTVTTLTNSGSLTRTDYKFVGWNTQEDGNGTSYAPGETFSIAGNTTLYAEWESVIPAPGSSGTISTSNIAYKSVDVSWTAATDDATAPSSLQYKLVYSTSNNIDSASDAESNGTTALDWSAGVTSNTVEGLAPGTQYYFNVLVQDEDDNIAAYDSVAATTAANTAPVFTVYGPFSIAENASVGAIVGDVNANDGNGGSADEHISYSIASGNTDTDSDGDGPFKIDAATGELTVLDADELDYETTASYSIAVQADDGEASNHTTQQTITVTVTNVNDNEPAITSDGGGTTAGVSIAEGTAAVTTVAASDADGDTPTYAISGGADELLFSIDATSGALTFQAAPDYEAPADADTNNAYIVEVTATDGTHATTQTITVTVTNVNEAPAITSDGGGATAAVNVGENGTAVTTVTATDSDLDELTYSISGGADELLFSIDATSGALTFQSAPDFESPTDADANNTYLVEVTVTDDGTGNLADSQTITVTVTNVNDNAPAIASNGGGTTAGVSIAEGTAAVTTVAASDADGDTPTYAISGGADELLFSIDATSGALTFQAAPDYEAPADADTNNAYIVEVTATDGTHATTQTITVTVTNMNEAPIAADDSYQVDEEQTLTVIAADGVLKNDTDSEHAALTATKLTDPAHGTLTLEADGSFTYTPDAEYTGTDSFTYEANDGVNASVAATVTITIGAVNDAPTISDIADQAIDEDGATASIAFTVGDPDNDASELIVTAVADDNEVVPLSGIVLSGDGMNRTIQVTPARDRNGEVVITVTVTDGASQASDTFVILIHAVNDAPTVDDGAATASEDELITIALPDFEALFHDAEGDSLHNIRIHKLPVAGTLTVSGVPMSVNQAVYAFDWTNIVYEPAAEWNGEVSFEWSGSDGEYASNTSVFKLVIDAVNDEITVHDFSAAGTEDTMLSLIAGDFENHFTDADGDALQGIRIVSLPTNGTLTHSGTAVTAGQAIDSAELNELAYTPNENWNGLDGFQWKGYDGTAYSVDPAEVTLDIAAVNDAPIVARPIDDQRVRRGQSFTIDISGLFTDVEDDSLTVTAATAPDGDMEIEGISAESLTLRPTRTGTHAINVTATDAEGASVTSAITVIVTDPPSSSGSGNGLSREEITVDIETGGVGSGAVVSRTVIVRTTNANGKMTDEVTFTEERARETIDALLKQGLTLARIIIPDNRDQVSEVTVKVPQSAIDALAGGKSDLEIFTNNVRIVVPNASMQEWGEDLFFRVVPIKTQSVKDEVEQRAKQEQIVREAAGDKSIRILGRPMVIETNMESKPVSLVLPLRDALPADAEDRQHILDNLVIFIEHDDGTKELVKGTVVNYADELTGIEFDIDKFSTFTMVYMENWEAYAAELQASESDSHAAYMNGYPNGTFQPNRTITRAEMAAIMSRIMTLSKNDAQNTVAYRDVQGHWAEEAIANVTSAGVMIGGTDGEFRPDDAVTRAETATIIARLQQAALTDDGRVTKWMDANGHWASASIRMLELAGWITGYEDGTFQPNRGITRAEAVVLINRVMGRGPLMGVDRYHWTDVPAEHWAIGHILEATLDHAFETTVDEGERFVKP